MRMGPRPAQSAPAHPSSYEGSALDALATCVASLDSLGKPWELQPSTHHAIEMSFQPRNVSHRRYNECLTLGLPLRQVSPARASGRRLISGRDGSRWRLVRSGIPLDAALDAAQVAAPEAAAWRLDENLAKLSLEDQEFTLLDDLLFCLQGVEGSYIRRVNGCFQMEVPPGADLSTAQFLQQLLPLCDDRAYIESFAEEHSQHEYGTVPPRHRGLTSSGFSIS